MSVTPLSAIRIAAEVGLAGGTVTGGTLAAKYGSQVASLTKENTNNKSSSIYYENTNDNAWAELNNANTWITQIESKVGSISITSEEWKNLKESISKAESKLKKIS